MRLFGSLIFIALLAGGAFAQHCPFDGGEMLVIELVDQKGEPMFGSSLDLTLVETDNPNAEAVQVLARLDHTRISLAGRSIPCSLPAGFGSLP